MKKIVLLLLAIGWSLNVAAQKYVRIDTVYRPYFDFDYLEWVSDTTHPLFAISSTKPSITLNTPAGRVKTQLTGDRMEYNYIAGGADIYGIMVGAPIQDYVIFDQDSLLLYEATEDSLIELAKILFDYHDSSAFSRIVLVDQFPWVYGDECGVRMRREEYDSPWWTFFFDEPIHVKDSFYVGHTTNTIYNQYNPELGVLGSSVLWHLYTTDGAATSYREFLYDSTCWMPPRNCKARLRFEQDSNEIRRYGLPMNEWINFESREFFFTVPILRYFDTIWSVDTPACTPVYNLSLMSRYGNTISLRWSHDGLHNEWQLSYGPRGFNPDDGTKVECNSNIWRFTDTVGIPMEAYVRTICRELDTLRYSEWCEPVEWLVIPERIDPAEGPGDELITVKPNPATDRVTAAAACVMERVEVFNASGMKYFQRDVEGHSATFTVGGWPEGVYLIVVQTPQGELTKKLVVGKQ